MVSIVIGIQAIGNSQMIKLYNPIGSSIQVQHVCNIQHSQLVMDGHVFGFSWRANSPTWLARSF